MKLTDLDPHFIKRSAQFEYDYTDDIKKAEGLSMKCPACHWAFARGRGGVDNVHSITLWRPSGAWDFVGHDYRDLSAMSGRIVCEITTGCQSRFHIKAGRVDFC